MQDVHILDGNTYLFKETSFGNLHKYLIYERAAGTRVSCRETLFRPCM